MPGRKAISQASLGRDVAGLSGHFFDLGAQAVDVNSQRVLENLVHGPESADQEIRSDDAAGAPHEHVEQLGLGGTQRNRLATHVSPLVREVDRQALVHLDDGIESVAKIADPPQDAADARNQLVGTERLNDVVFGILFQSLGNSLLFIHRSKHNDGEIRILLHDAAELEAVHPGHPKVDDREVGQAVVRDDLQRALARIGGQHIEAREVELLLHEPKDVWVVVNHKHTLEARLSGELGQRHVHHWYLRMEEINHCVAIMRSFSDIGKWQLATRADPVYPVRRHQPAPGSPCRKSKPMPDLQRRQLQIALDVPTTGEALRLAGEIYPHFDIAEIGTPLLIEQGLSAVEAVKDRFPGRLVLADTKIVDAGYMEAGSAFRRGADIATVLAIADDRTVEGALSAARESGGRIMADMLYVPDLLERARRLEAMGVQIICLHTAHDRQGLGVDPLGELLALRASVGCSLAIAGGIGPENAARALALGADLLVVGSAIIRSETPSAVAARIWKLLGREGGNDAAR